MLIIQPANGGKVEVGEFHHAGSPSAMKSVLLWNLLRERRRAVTVRIRDGVVAIEDGVSSEPIVPWDNADPGDLASAAYAQAFMAGLRDEAGWLRRRRIRIVPMSVSPPRTYAFVTFTEESDNDMTIRVQYDIPRWKWRIRHLIWKIGNKLLNR